MCEVSWYSHALFDYDFCNSSPCSLLFLHIKPDFAAPWATALGSPKSSPTFHHKTCPLGVSYLSPWHYHLSGNTETSCILISGLFPFFTHRLKQTPTCILMPWQDQAIIPTGSERIITKERCLELPGASTTSFDSPSHWGLLQGQEEWLPFHILMQPQQHNFFLSYSPKPRSDKIENKSPLSKDNRKKINTEKNNHLQSLMYELQLSHI